MLAIALFSSPAAVAEVVSSQTAPAGLPVASTSPASVPSQQVGLVDYFMDIPHEYLSEKFVNLASDVDGFFGDDRNFQESNKSVLQFDLTRVIDSNSAGNFVPAFRAKLHLPGAQHRLRRWQENIHLLLESNPDQNQNIAGGGTTQQSRPSLFKEVTTPDSYGAALRLENDDSSPWRVSADAGLKLVGTNDVLKLNHSGLDPYVRSRVSMLKTLGVVQLKLAETIFWFNTTGAGETTQFDADYHYSDPLLYRATSVATWYNDTQRFDLRQDLDLFHTLSERASMLYQVSAVELNQLPTQISEYIAAIFYRQRLNRDWIFAELSPQLHYPKQTNYQLNAQFVVRLEILFSK